MRIAIIPARGGSKRIKNKNIVDFFGQPIIYYSLRAARDSKLFDKIHVSTDSEEISKTVEALGFPVEFLRTPSLADDRTALVPVLKWVLEQYRERGFRFAEIALILPCAPLIEAEDLVEAYKLFAQRTPRRPLLPVARFPVPIEWAFTRSQDSALRPVIPGAAARRSQDFEKKFYDTGTFVFYGEDHIVGETPVADSDYVSCILPATKAVDIDDEEDLELARALYRGREDPVLR